MTSQPSRGEADPLKQNALTAQPRNPAKSCARGIGDPTLADLPTVGPRGWAWVLALGLAGLSGTIAAPALAQTSSRLTTCRSLANQALGVDPVQVFPLADNTPLNLRDLIRQSGRPSRPGECPQAGAVVSSNTTCQRQSTIPSLWWAEDQYGSGRLIVNWLAYAAEKDAAEDLGRVDLVVSRQIWGDMSYFDRYEFLQKFGNVTQGYGYNTRIFDVKGNCLATYTCTTFAIATGDNQAPPLTCSLIFGY